MRISLPVALVTTATLVLAGCASSGPSAGGSTSSPAASSAPAETPTATSTSTGTESTEAASPEPTEPPTTEAPAPTTDLPATVMLPQERLYPEDGARTEREGVETWLLPDGCEQTAPDGAAAMRTVVQGDGAFEDAIGQQQVAVFADVDAAVSEADRLGSVLAACAGSEDVTTGYATEPVEVGAQGTVLIVSYNDDYTPGQDEMSLGYVLSVTRRGNAVTLVANAGGEYSIKASRELVVPELQAAWEQLCAYETDGC